ncbi:Bacterial extracellular solute-binding protein, family 7 [compost metagenome]
MLISSSTLEKLTPEQRKAVEDAAKESTEFQKGLWNAAVDAARKESADKFGVKFITPDIAEFQKAVQPMYDELKNNKVQYPVFEQIRAASSQAK